MRHLIQNGVIQVSSLAKIEAHANTSPIKRPTPELSLSVAGRDRRLTAIERRRLREETELSNGSLRRGDQTAGVGRRRGEQLQAPARRARNPQRRAGGGGSRRAATRRNKTAP